MHFSYPKLSALAAACISLMAVVPGSHAQEITIDGTEFVLSDGRPVWLNGINAAWIDWNDFGGNRFREFQTNPDDRSTRGWDEEIASYAAAGINCARIWIDCDGTHVLRYDAEGNVIGHVDGFIEDVGRLLDIGQKYGVYIMPVLTSFDHAREKDWETTWQNWRALLGDDAKIDSYIDNVVIPLVQAYPDHPYLFAWEICNEPEWMYTGDALQRGTTRDRVVAFHARVAAAINKNTATPVTTGTAGWQWMSDRGGFNGKLYSDASLQEQFDDPDARLDFYQIHYYGWMQNQGASPFDEGDTPTFFLQEAPDRPVIIGECPGLQTPTGGAIKTVVEEYTSGLANGYQGVFAWSSSGHDGAGTLPEISVATTEMLAVIPRLIQVDLPMIAEHPAASTIGPGSSDMLGSTVTGFGPFTYQWIRDGQDIPGATDETLTVTGGNDTGDYQVRVTGPTGRSVVSHIAGVDSGLANPGRLKNLSVNAYSGTGGEVLTAGFVTGGGSGDANLLIRGVAQKLTEFGVTGTMDDPVISAFASGATDPLATNDNWGEVDAGVMEQLGAFALDAGSGDAAIAGPVAGGQPISVEIRDASGGTGRVLAEIYDAEQTLSGQRLLNLSARSAAGGDKGALTAGFVIDGNVPHTILVRGIGPALNEFGLNGLPNPTLSLVRQSDGVIMGSNDDWHHDGADGVVSQAMQSVGAFPLSTGSGDAAMLITVQPGAYTVQINDSANRPGITLAEIYVVD